MPSETPTLLMQDISLLSLHQPDQWRALSRPAGITVGDLSDHHRVIDWWFATYGPYAVAVKSQAAYGRALDFDDVPAERAAEPFRRLINGDALAPTDRKAVEDHLFWYGVRKATACGLPVKLHTGYYAGQNGMPMARPAGNPSEVTEILRKAPDTTFVLMHIGYPFQEQMVAIAKHWHNAVIDMCWAWIIDPESSVRFLRSMLLTAPNNKVLTFGGDFIPVEPVVGHAMVARRGIALALTGLVRDGWLTRAQAVELVEPIMRGNAHRIFGLATRAKALETAPWLATSAKQGAED
jgi:predicted TIM-barrel fold metal-dependent hydrolase